MMQDKPGADFGALVEGVNNLQNTPTPTPPLPIGDGAQFTPPADAWRPDPGEEPRARAVLSHVLSNCQISDCSQENPAPIVQDADGTGWLYEGLNVVFGAQKSKKTTFSNILAAAFLDVTPQGAPALCGLCSEYIANESAPGRKIWRKVVYFDTEQSDADAARTKRNISQLLGLDPLADLPGLEIYTLRDFTPKDRAAALFAYLEHTRAADCLPQIVALDNLQDFVNSINDELECGAFIQRLNTAANALRIAIVIIQHTPAADNERARGFLGSLAFQKSAIVWKIQRPGMENYSTISLPFCRYEYPENLGAYRLEYIDGTPTLYREENRPAGIRRGATDEQAAVIENFLQEHPGGVTVSQIRAEIIKQFPKVTKPLYAGKIWMAYKNSPRGQEFARVEGNGPRNTKVFPRLQETIL